MSTRPSNRTRRLSLLTLLSLVCVSVTEAQTPPDALENAGVRVCAGGDVTLGTNLDTTWATTASQRYGTRFKPFPDADSLLSPMREMLGGANIVLLNIEGAIGEGFSEPKCGPHSKSCFAFRQPVASAAALARVGNPAKVIGNVANNHSHDAGRAGLRQTVNWLQTAGVAVTGNDTLATEVVTEAGDTVAFLGFHTARDVPDARDLAAVVRHVSRAAARWKRVVVTAHLGAEGIGAQRTANTSEGFLGTDRGNPVAFAHAALDAGAGWVVMHGPHVLRAGEWRGDGLVFYSLGNLLTYGPFRITEPMNRGLIACVSLDQDGRPFNAFLMPTWQRFPGFIARDPARRGLILIDSLSRLDFPLTGVSADPYGFVRRTSPSQKVKQAQR